MPISGNLRTMDFSDLLHWLASSGKSGTLVVDGASSTKKVYLRNGAVTAVSSDAPKDMLGYYLVGWRYLTEEQLAAAIAEQSRSELMLGELLVERGFLSREDVEYVIRLRIEASVYDLMQWTEGSFSFLDDEVHPPCALDVRIPIDQLLFEGARQRDERNRNRALVPDAQHVPALVANRPPTTVGPEEEAVVEAIDGTRSIEDIALDCRLPEFLVFSFVTRCVAEQSLTLTPPRRDADGRPGSSHGPWSDLAQDIRTCLEQDRILDALKLLTALLERFSKRRRAVEIATVLESEIEARLASSPLTGDSRVAPSREIRELIGLDCEPGEGYVLSRVGRGAAVREILAGLPGPPLQNRVLLQNLHRRGIIRIVDSES